MSPDRRKILKSWSMAWIASLRLRRLGDVRQNQNRLWKRLQDVIARTPALAAFCGRPLQHFPIWTPAQVRAAFDDWNTLGLKEKAVCEVALAAEAGGKGLLADGTTAGLSTGSSGVRGLFLATPRERADYIGHALARLLPVWAPFQNWRIALCLRADSALYRDVGAAGRFAFEFIGLDMSPRDRIARLDAFKPHVLIAPSHILADLARRQTRPMTWPLRRLFYGAEPMAEGERAWIAEQLGVRPDPIYQATEGFLGAPCRFGTLHLNEDVLIIERQAVEGTNRFRPIVTDLRRSSQPVVRLLMDDLLEPIQGCPCGSPLLAVRGVEGRAGDLWRWGSCVLTPREVTNALVSALGPELDWRATGAPDHVLIEVDPEYEAAAVEALVGLLEGLPLKLAIRTAAAPDQTGPKRHRVGWSHDR